MRLVSYLDVTGDRLGVEHADGRIWSSHALGAGLPGTMAELLAAGGAGPGGPPGGGAKRGSRRTAG